MIKLYNRIRSKLAGKEFINKAIIVYAFTVLTYQIFHLIVPFRQFLEFAHLSFFSSLLAVLGFGIFVWDTLIDRVYLKTKYSYFLIALIAIMLISTFINWGYGFVNNVKVIIWQIVQMLVIFPLYKRINKDSFFKPFKVYFICISAIFVITNIISFVLYYTTTAYLAQYEGGIIRQGFMEGRLFGLYSSPHFSSVLTLMLAIGSVYYCFKTDKFLLKLLYCAMAIMHFLFAVASGTRSVIVGLAVAVAIVAFLKVSSDFSLKNKFKSFTRTAFSLVIAVAVMLGVVGAFSATGSIMTKSLYAVVGSESIGGDIIIDNETELERVDVDIENISNHRFEIWKNYFDVASDKPQTFLVGMTPGSYMVYIRENYPDIFIVEYIKEHYPRLYVKDLIYDTHNAYFGAFVATGIIGLAIVLLFLITGFVRTIRYIRKNGRASSSVCAVLTAIIFILVSSFFDSDLFFKCTSTSVIFWLLTGVLLMLTQNNDVNECVEK